MSDTTLATRPWDQDVQDIADQLVMGVDFERGVHYVGELADLVMRERRESSAWHQAAQWNDVLLPRIAALEVALESIAEDTKPWHTCGHSQRALDALDAQNSKAAKP